jgi:integrase
MGFAECCHLHGVYKGEDMVKLRIRNHGRLYLDVYYDGQRRWETLDLVLGKDKRENAETLRIAEIVRQKRELQLASGKYDLVDPIEGKRTLVDFAQILARTYKPKDHLPKSLRYLREYAGEIRISEVTERFIEGYKDFLLGTELSKHTAAHYFFALRHALKIAVRDRVIPRNPADAIKGISIPESVKVNLTAEELQRLASTPITGRLGAEVRRAFLFGCLTGLRISDLKSLTWGDVQRDPLQVAKRQVKTGRVVWNPLNEDAWRIIDDKTIHKRTEKVFPRLTQSQTNTNQYLMAWVKRAGIDKQIGWHTARHTFAMLELDNGADFYTVSKLLGHTKPATTAVYLKGSDKLKREAIAALPSLKLPKFAL